MTWEDRLRLAEVLAPRADIARRALEDDRRCGVAHGDRGGPSRRPAGFVPRAARVPVARCAGGATAQRVARPPPSAPAPRGAYRDGAATWQSRERVRVEHAGLRVCRDGAGPRRRLRTPAIVSFVRVLAPNDIRRRVRLASGVDTTHQRRRSPIARDGARAEARVLRDARRRHGGRPASLLRARGRRDSACGAGQAGHSRHRGGALVRAFRQTARPVSCASTKAISSACSLRVTVPADREFVAVEDPLPAGLEVIDEHFGHQQSLDPLSRHRERGRITTETPARRSVLPGLAVWLVGPTGAWSPWEHKETHDDRVSYFARLLWTGSYTASYIARATTAGSFVAPPAYAEEMYNPAVQGRSSGRRFLVDRNALRSHDERTNCADATASS